MTPETKARQQIDQKLEQAGWVIQDMKQLNLGAAVGVAVREYPTDTGPADYVLFVNRQAVGVIEAKKDSAGENLTVVEAQTQRYAIANLKWRKDNTPLRFLFEATGQIVRFTENADPAPRSREIFHFFRPETLAAWLAQTETLRRRLAEQMPVLCRAAPGCPPEAGDHRWCPSAGRHPAVRVAAVRWLRSPRPSAPGHRLQARSSHVAATRSAPWPYHRRAGCRAESRAHRHGGRRRAAAGFEPEKVWSGPPSQPHSLGFGVEDRQQVIQRLIHPPKVTWLVDDATIHALNDQEAKR
jgi:hypothetical protein